MNIRDRNAERFSGLNIAVIALLLATTCLSGCAIIDIEKAFSSKDKQGPPEPVKVTAIWTHTTLDQTGQVPVRGFGGRIMFYPAPDLADQWKDKDKKSRQDELPIRVHGTLTVYAFDETTDGRRGDAPSRKFVFTSDELKKHYSKSILGPSYSIWLPWDEVGGPPRQISLMIRFEPKKGKLIVSESSRHLLPGVPDEDHPIDRMALTKKRLKAKVDGPVTQAGYEVPVATGDNSAPDGRAAGDSMSDALPAVDSSSRMTTVTIDVPQNFVDRLASAPPDVNPPEILSGAQAAGPSAGAGQTVTVTLGAPLQGLPAAGSGPAQSSVPTGRFSRPGLDHLRRQPFRGGSLSSLRPTPRPDQSGPGQPGLGQAGLGQSGLAPPVQPQSAPWPSGQAQPGSGQWGQASGPGQLVPNQSATGALGEWRPVTEEIPATPQPPTSQRAQ